MRLSSGAIRASAAAVALSLCACNANGGPASSPGIPASFSAPMSVLPQRLHTRSVSGKIQHVVIMVQENRSFNNLFYGYPGAYTVKSGKDSNGNKIELQPVGLETSWDIDHSSNSFFAACNGTGSIPGTNCRMNGFNNEYVGCGHYGPKCPNANPPYSYVPQTETQPYFDMAGQYVLADRMYASNFDASSFISHQYIISAQAVHAVNFPNSSWGCPGGSGDKISEVGPQRQIPDGSETVCWDPNTLGDELDKAKLSWGFYASSINCQDVGCIWSAYQAINHIYNGNDWKTDIISPQTQFFSDVASGNMRTVSWITPTWANSDHAGSGSKTGPSWVTSVVNAIGTSKYWNSTAIFIFWDDYGGWYDPAAPKYVDYDGLGLRIPMLIISPYAKQGYVSHVHYEHGSILKFIEDQFHLARLSASDKRAISPAKDAFDFTQSPRKFQQFQAPYNKDFFLRQPPDNHTIDDQ